MARSLTFIVVFLLGVTAMASAQQPEPAMPGRGGGAPAGRFGGPPRDRVPLATGTAKVTGRVVSAETASPIRRAQIRLSSSDGRGNKQVTTDADGRYEIPSLPAGRYRLYVSKAGYVALEYGQARPFEIGRPLDIADGQALDKMDFSLPRGSAITGRITDELGDAVTDAQVQAMRYQFTNGERQLVNAGRTATTDDLGQFRIFGLMPGDYVVRASLRADPNPQRPPAAPEESESPMGYPGTYYPGVADVAQAQTVTVSLGQELSSVAFPLVPARLSSIAGTVISSEGRPLAGAIVLLRPGTGGAGVRFGVPGGNQAVRADGSFSLVNVAPGDYILEVQQRPQGMRNLPDGIGALEFASVPLSVAGDIEGLAVVTTPGASVSGRVVFQGQKSQTTTPRGMQVTAAAAAGGSVAPIAGRAPGRGSVSNDGSFELRGLAGPHVIRLAGVPQGWAVKSVSLDGADITDAAFDFKPGTGLTNLTITLTDRVSEVSGDVRDLRGQPVADYVLIVFAEDPKLWGPQSRHVTTTRPNQNGAFSIKGLPPARYLAAAVPSLESGMQNDTALLGQLRAQAKSFSLAEGQTLNLNLEMPAQ